jgi:hypothetical protein
MFPYSLSRKILKYLIRNHQKKIRRNTSGVSFKNAVRIAILSESQTIDTSQYIIDFISDIRKYSKDISTLEYLNNSIKLSVKSWKQTQFYLHNKNLNFLNLPKREPLKEFLEKEYDIIINLSITNNIYLHYLATITNAKLKIGPYNKEFESCYDFMIHVDDDTDIHSFVSAVDTYLKMINNNPKI